MNNYFKKFGGLALPQSTYYKVVGILIFMFLLYKFGYLFGSFVANINL